MTRVGGAIVAPDGTLAVFGVREYDFEKKKWTSRLFLLDLAMAESASEEELAARAHLTQLTEDGNSPVWSPCGNFIAFLSSRGENSTSAVWIIPARGPGEARLLKVSERLHRRHLHMRPRGNPLSYCAVPMPRDSLHGRNSHCLWAI